MVQYYQMFLSLFLREFFTKFQLNVQIVEHTL